MTPKGVLRLQRSAGNAAVSDALAIQRKRVGKGKDMLEFDSGVIYGQIDAKNGMINISGEDSWISG